MFFVFCFAVLLEAFAFSLSVDKFLPHDSLVEPCIFRRMRFRLTKSFFELLGEGDLREGVIVSALKAVECSASLILKTL